MSATDQLSKIAELLDALPDRLASVLGSQASGQAGSARSDAMDDEEKSTKARKAKTPRAWDATERLFGSLGQFSPAFGKVAGVMRTTEAAGKWYESVFGNTSTPDKKDKPTVAVPKKTMLSSASQPSVMNRTVLSPAASGPAFQPGGGGPGGSAIQGLGELNQTLRELNASVQQLKAAMDQLDPSPSEDAERAQTQRVNMWQQEELPKGDQADSGQKEQASVQSLLGTLRPQQNVPSAEQASKGEGGADAGDLASVAMLIARIYGS